MGEESSERPRECDLQQQKLEFDVLQGKPLELPEVLKHSELSHCEALLKITFSCCCCMLCVPNTVVYCLTIISSNQDKLFLYV